MVAASHQCTVPSSGFARLPSVRSATTCSPCTVPIRCLPLEAPYVVDLDSLFFRCKTGTASHQAWRAPSGNLARLVHFQRCLRFPRPAVLVVGARQRPVVLHRGGGQRSEEHTSE